MKKAPVDHPSTNRRRCTTVAVTVAMLIVGSVIATTWNLHGVITRNMGPEAARGSHDLAFLGRVILANGSAVCLAASGILTVGVGTLVMAPVVAANLGILMGAGQEWLSPEAFQFGLALHGTGEAMAITFGTAAGIYPVLRMIPGLRDCSFEGSLVPRYTRAVTEAAPLVFAAGAIVLAAALWETFISVSLV